MKEKKAGFIYVLSHPAMPGLLKIGMTEAEDVQDRISQLYNTSLPFPFKLEYAAKVYDPVKIEQALHLAFAPNRVNAKREFFAIDPSQPIAILEVLKVEDRTHQIEVEMLAQPETSSDREAANAYSKRRPRFNFSEMGIPNGSQLISIKTGECADVLNDRAVVFRGETMSLTQATRMALGLDENANVGPGLYWSYDGKRLRDIYQETYTTL